MKRILFGVAVCVLLCSMVRTVPPVPLHTESIMHPDSYHIIQLEQELFMVHVDGDNEDTSCQYRVYNFPATINQAGLFRLAGDITQELTINSSNVTVDFSGHRISGGSNGISINGSLNNIALRNGVISAVSQHGVDIANGCANLLLEDLSISDGESGIHALGLTESIIRNCTLTENGTAVECTNCENVLIDGCNALSNTNGGFCLNGSSACAVKKSSALATGEGSGSTANQTIVGFSSTDGTGNLFEWCIANGTQGLQVTDSDSLVAGFALRGSESCSKIIECEASNTQTSESGYTVPYGIVLDPTFDLELLQQKTDVGIIGVVRGLSWDPSGVYLITGGSSATSAFAFLKYDRLSNEIIEVDTKNDHADNAFSSEWSPTGQYVAAGVDGDTSVEVFFYQFNRNTQKAALIDSFGLPGTADALGISWTSDEQFIAVTGGVDVHIYKLDRITERFTEVTTFTFGASVETSSLDWSPDNLFLAVGGRAGSDPRVKVYSFDAATLTFSALAGSSLSGFTNVQRIDWSPDGAYLLIGDLFAGSTMVNYHVYRFNKSTLTLVGSSGSFVGSTAISNWSPDGAFIVVQTSEGGTNATTRFYRFDATSPFSDLLVTDNAGRSDSFSWSPDGALFARGSGNNTLRIDSVLNFPTKNVIKDNTVYCNSGGATPSGIGISGSSIENMIIGNTSYNNPLDPFMVFQNYAFVLNVFNPFFEHSPTAVENISVTTPIQTPLSIALAAQQIENKLCDIYTKIDALVP